MSVDYQTKQRSMIIPRIFHRIWLGNQPIPEEYIQFGETWQSLHPGWKMILWTDKTLPSLKNAWAYKQSNSFSAKSNIARYEILLQYGGVYVDTDFECLKNLEPILKDVECFVGWERDDLANNAIIGTLPFHPFLQDLVDSLEQNVRTMPDADPSIIQSGPYYLTKILHRHPDVTIFPPNIFYPYEWHERWRRREQFPNAYAVHHWSMTWRETKWSKRKQLGDGKEPCLSIVVLNRDDGLRLEWVLEGLCVQTVTNFEVIVINNANDKNIQNLVDRFKRVLNVKYIYLKPNDGKIQSIGRNLGLKQACAHRILFLDGDCLPDPDLVEIHANFGAMGFVPFGFQRIYPARKLYPFVPPVDYQGIQKHTFEDPRRSYPYSPFYGDWRDISGFCFSVPTDALRQLGGFDQQLHINHDQDLARRLCQRKYRLLPLWRNSYVTHLSYPEDTIIHFKPHIDVQKEIFLYRNF